MNRVRLSLAIMIGAGCVLAVAGYFLALLLGVYGARYGVAGAFFLLPFIFGFALVEVRHMTAIREILKQVAVWLAIVVLLPLTAWYAASATSGMPDPREGMKARDRITAQLDENEKLDKGTTDKAQKVALRQQRDQLRQELEELGDEQEQAQQAFFFQVFWIAFPVGLLALIIGTFLPAQAVGSALMFGGLASLTEGCYFYWDRMHPWSQFISLIVVLVVAMVLGIWRFWPVIAMRPTIQQRREVREALRDRRNGVGVAH
jgi:ABC-type multidrug transport system fused ATPase/permease subunit